MVVTMRQIMRILGSAEPKYKSAAMFGVEALPHLEKLIKNKNVSPLIAAKAAYMASLIPDDKAVEILMLAAQSDSAQIRVAVADGIRNLSLSPAEKVLNILNKDQDEGVRRIALRSMELTRKTK